MSKARLTLGRCDGRIISGKDKDIANYQYRQNKRFGPGRGQRAARLLAALLLHLISALSLLVRGLSAFFVLLVWRPGRAVLRFFFYNFAVKGYAWYRRLLGRLGWQGKGSNLFSFLLNYKLAHVLVVAVTLALVAANLAPGTSAMGADKAHGTVLSELTKSEFEEFEDGEGELIVETFSGEAVIGPAEQSYLDSLGAFRPQPRASYGPDEVDGTGLPSGSEGDSLVKPELAETKKTKRPRTGVVEYTVAPGDTISTIAQEFEVSVNTILWENNKTAYSLIRPGDKLAVLPMTGVSHLVRKGETLGAIAKKYEVTEQEIMDANRLAAGDSLAIGVKLIVPGGRQYVEPARQVKSYTGFSALRDIVSAPDAAPAAGNKMNWPTAGGRITQRYSVRHYAVDIANKIGTPIYAADAGTVELAGWGSGYGNQIVVDHGGGKKTRYAHLSKFNVKKGDMVSKGQVVGGMGSTGWSTGSHLHFEVIIGGRKQNPLNYIK